jgi:hypothetical protein
MKRFRAFALVVCTIVVSATSTSIFLGARTEATTIIKSKSNIANNRMASPIGTSRPGPWDVVVLCQSCAYPPMPEEGCLILMDSQTGNLRLLR